MSFSLGRIVTKIYNSSGFSYIIIIFLKIILSNIIYVIYR